MRRRSARAPFRRPIFRKDHQPRGIAIEAVNKKALARLRNSRKNGFGIHAVVFIRNQNVFVLVYDGKPALPLLRGREVIAHRIARFQRHVGGNFLSVYADFPRL